METFKTRHVRLLSDEIMNVIEEECELYRLVCQLNTIVAEDEDIGLKKDDAERISMQIQV
jgi:hypothetical protein